MADESLVHGKQSWLENLTPEQESDLFDAFQEGFITAKDYKQGTYGGSYKRFLHSRFKAWLKEAIYNI